MGYMENSYSNSNNGGSVNSQDSIWQMKSAAANGVNQPYDMSGYANTESDYPAHPHYLPQQDNYRDGHNLSRQQFCSEPFPAVIKSQKHTGWLNLRVPFPLLELFSISVRVEKNFLFLFQQIRRTTYQDCLIRRITTRT